ncbi:MAG: hypothetical protein WC969_12135 [Elusimicrobiota bacterium]
MFDRNVLRKGFVCVAVWGLWAAALALSGCSSMGLREESVSREGSDEVRRSERLSVESHTLSRLAAIERSLDDFIKAEKRVPKTLDELVPKFLAEIPEVELGLRGHRDNAAVRYYPAAIILDDQIDGTRLKDTGGWGYVYNEHRVIVFVDCVHKMMKGSYWYQARGVF